MYMCVNIGDKFFFRRGELKPGYNSFFLKNGKTVICRNSIGEKSEIFLDLE